MEERASFGPVLVNRARFMILGLNERQDTNVGDWLGSPRQASIRVKVRAIATSYILSFFWLKSKENLG